MGYSGENNCFRFSDGCCESLPGRVISAADAASFGETIALNFRRFSVGCDSFSHIHHLHALCSGISGTGKEVYILENTDLSSFRFGYPVLSSDCGIFLSGSGCLKISIYNADKMPLSGEIIAEIMNSHTPRSSSKCGKIIPVSSFREIYICNLKERLTEHKLNAAVSCGTRSIRTLWEEFFTNECDDLVFQVSTDGQNVNAYSATIGFIPMEKLQAAYSALFDNSESCSLPDNACVYAQNSISNSYDAFIPRFITDPLYMCTKLVSERDRFLETLRFMPEVTTVKREIIVNFSDLLPLKKVYDSGNSKVFLDRSGKNRISMLIQSLSSETASELNDFWSHKLASAENIRDVII